MKYGNIDLQAVGTRQYIAMTFPPYLLPKYRTTDRRLHPLDIVPSEDGTVEIDPKEVDIGLLQAIGFEPVGSNRPVGPSSKRPTTNLTFGDYYFDTTLGKALMWGKDGGWLDGDTHKPI